MDQQIADTAFASAWRKAGGDVQAVAKVLNINLRSVLARRRKVERRMDMTLPTADRYQRKAYNEAARGDPTRGAIATLKVRDGAVLVGSDAHRWPGPLTTMQRGFIKVAKSLRDLKAIVMNGDVFDGAAISRYPSIGWEKRPEVREELDAVRELLEPLETLSLPRYWTAGNHDLRFESRLALVAPEYRDVKGIHLKDHFPNWLPCWRLDINDDVIVRHRELGGEHAGFNNVVRAGKTIVTGHDHRTGVNFYRDYRGVRYGVRTGFLGDSPLDPQFIHYLEAKEPNWHPAFAVLTFKRGVLLPPELATRHDDKHIVFRGEVIRV